MAMAVGQGGGGVKADINITPLVDVVLVLLIIFMVITPMLQRGKAVKLPEANKSAEDKNSSDPLIISITPGPERGLYIESQKYTESEFIVELKNKLSIAPDKKILLKGDQSLTFEDIRKVMAMARDAGAKAINLGVQERK